MRPYRFLHAIGQVDEQDVFGTFVVSRPADCLRIKLLILEEGPPLQANMYSIWHPNGFNLSLFGMLQRLGEDIYATT